MSGTKGMKIYPVAIREKVVRIHIEDGITNLEIMKQLERRIDIWCRRIQNTAIFHFYMKYVYP